jgi:hypothetical protein
MEPNDPASSNNLLNSHSFTADTFVGVCPAEPMPPNRIVAVLLRLNARSELAGDSEALFNGKNEQLPAFLPDPFNTALSLVVNNEPFIPAPWSA